MAGRTFATGDIHGDLDALLRIEALLPPLDEGDTLVFVGDYIDRGPRSAQVIDHLRSLPRRTPARVVTLRGNHEDAWLKVVDHGWPEFVIPPGHGCLEAMESFIGPVEDPFSDEWMAALLSGSFLPADVVAWMRSLPYFYEDEHAIYVHAGLSREDGLFRHPSETTNRAALLWHRDQDFFHNYRGKRVVFGHTVTDYLPQELSSYTPEDPSDLWAGPCTVGLDTGAGKGGFLTTVELPSMRVYESRRKKST
ncbi:MAG: serine/threonine protein phosphatase [Myxococcales bacterium]|nr:serine/threonine protein phosphatase [Myxococcales bacterium]